jgi:hypothetical protein
VIGVCEGARVVSLLQSRARHLGAVEWNDTTDIVGGSAGSDCFAAGGHRPCDASARDLAAKAGRRLSPGVA